MYAKRRVVSIVAVALTFALPVPAHASGAAAQPSQETLRAQAAFCVPCAVAAAAVAVRVARAVRTARAASRLRAAGRVLKARAGQGVTITRQRVGIVRKEAGRVATRGRSWVRSNWQRLTPFVRACLEGMATLETGEILKDGVMTIQEWREFLRNYPLGMLNAPFFDEGYRDLYYTPDFDLRKRTDNWLLACAAGMAWRGITG